MSMMHRSNPIIDQTVELILDGEGSHLLVGTRPLRFPTTLGGARPPLHFASRTCPHAQPAAGPCWAEAAASSCLLGLRAQGCSHTHARVPLVHRAANTAQHDGAEVRVEIWKRHTGLGRLWMKDKFKVGAAVLQQQQTRACCQMPLMLWGARFRGGARSLYGCSADGRRRAAARRAA